MIPLISYLKLFGLQALIDTYSIKAHYSNEYPELVCLCYSHTDTPKNDITNDCRGIILNKDTFEIICRPFTRFGDLSPKADNKGFDFSNFKCTEKIDGSLINMYHYDGQWHVGTKGTADASGYIDELGMTYDEYFFTVFSHKFGYSLPKNEDCTYIFEFKFPCKSQFIVQCEKPSITLIGIRNRVTGKEIDISQNKEGYAYVYASECRMTILQSMVDSHCPAEMEGMVIVDANFNRLKVKATAYELLSQLRQNNEIHNLNILIRASKYIGTDMTKSMELYLNRYELFPTYTKILQAKNLLKIALQKALLETKDMDGKELGLLCKTHEYGDVLFVIKKFGNKIPVISERLYTNYIKRLLPSVEAKSYQEMLFILTSLKIELQELCKN